MMDMIEAHTIQKLQRVCLAMFRKNILGIYHGSISARVEMNKFVINHREAIFDALAEEDFVLLYQKRDYRWKEASLDSDIHARIYELIPDAKYIAYAMSPFATAYSLNNEVLVPQDYFGSRMFPRLKIYDPKSFDDWYERADVEISRHLMESDHDLMIIRGYGIYAHARDANMLAKMFAVVENSCKLLLYDKIVQ